MCKIISFTNTSKISLKKVVNDIGNTLLKSEKDGFGYAVKGKQGVYGEKTTSQVFRSRLGKKSIQLPIIKNTHSVFGNVSELCGPGVFHGRTSTNSEGLVNTHPMIRPDKTGSQWYLIHNGVVDDKGVPYSKLTDNDSEDVLYRLIEGIESVESSLEGYYAFAAIDPQGRLHIGRDGYATLFMAWSDVLDTYLIATTESLLTKLNKMLDAKIGPIDEIEDDVYMIFEGNTLVHHQFIQSLGFSRAQAVHSTSSLGRDLGNATNNPVGLSSGVTAGGEIVIRGEHHRPVTKLDAKSEADWQNESQWNAALDSLASVHDTERLEEEEMDYYALRRELDTMDAGYTICDAQGVFMEIHEFYKLDYVAQELCTIIRPDGTVVDLDVSNLRRLG